MEVQVIFHPKNLGREFCRNRALSPYLSVRVRIAASHELSLVFENLNIVNVRDGTESCVLLYADADDILDVIALHFCQGEIVSRSETDDTAYSRFCSGNKHAFPGLVFFMACWNQCAEIVRRFNCA